MQPVFKYSPEQNTLVEQPTMEKPVVSGFSPLSFKEDMKDIDRWNKHIASLRSYPTDYPIWPRADLIEGKDFKLIECGVSETYFKAVPLPKPEQGVNIDEVLSRSWQRNLDEIFPTEQAPQSLTTLWNNTTYNGMREMTEERFYQAIKELRREQEEDQGELFVEVYMICLNISNGFGSTSLEELTSKFQIKRR